MTVFATMSTGHRNGVAFGREIGRAVLVAPAPDADGDPARTAADQVAAHLALIGPENA